MSESNAPDWNGPGRALYTADCRGCDHYVRARVPVNAVQHNVEGVRVRCAQCRTTNYIVREESNSAEVGGNE